MSVDEWKEMRVLYILDNRGYMERRPFLITLHFVSPFRLSPLPLSGFSFGAVFRGESLGGDLFGEGSFDGWPSGTGSS
jgi:hypothetical protein